MALEAAAAMGVGSRARGTTAGIATSETVAGTAVSEPNLVQPIAQAIEASGTVRNVAGYQVWASAGRVGSTYNVNVLGLYATENSQGLRALLGALRSEAVASGATTISISGSAIINPSIGNISEAAVSRFGLSIIRVNPETIHR